jgi:hypothetical protein
MSWSLWYIGYDGQWPLSEVFSLYDIPSLSSNGAWTTGRNNSEWEREEMWLSLLANG